MTRSKPYITNDFAADAISLLAAWVGYQDQPDTMDVSEFQCVREQILAEVMGLGTNTVRVKIRTVDRE